MISLDSNFTSDLNIGSRHCRSTCNVISLCSCTRVTDFPSVAMLDVLYRARELEATVYI